MTDWLNFKEDLHLVPNREGIYLLGNTQGKVVYVGRADELQNRLAQHPDPQNDCLQGAGIRVFAYEECPDSEDREEILIDRYKPTCNSV